jgi:hypothetical protein
VQLSTGVESGWLHVSAELFMEHPKSTYFELSFLEMLAVGLSRHMAMMDAVSWVCFFQSWFVC